MPIFVEDNHGKKTTTHAGEVIEVRRFRAQRNMSGTLDYSDYQSVECCEALVYMGRMMEVYNYEVNTPTFIKRKPIDRFKWVDCSNHFVWRGADHRTPVVDDLRHPDVVIDYVEYVEAKRADDARLAAEATLRDEIVRKETEELERNRPVRGKKMIVVKGRKVKKGTVGIVAYVHSNGGVLLKDEKNWKDRDSQGVWVDARNLKAVG